MGTQDESTKKLTESQAKAKSAAMKILLLGFLIPLFLSLGALITTGYRTGFLPVDETYRHGVVTVHSCERMSWWHPLTKKCAATVEHWDQDVTEPDDFTLTDADAVWVVSGSDLHGTVEVDSRSTDVATGTTTVRRSSEPRYESAEVIMPTTQWIMPGWLSVLLAIGCFIVSFAIGILLLRLARPYLIRRYGDPRIQRPDPQ